MSGMLQWTFALFLHLIWRFGPISSQNVPAVACPSYFQYLHYGNRYIGKITIPNSFPGVTVVTVKLSQRGGLQSNNYGSLSLYDDEESTKINIQNGLPVSYLVEFPFPNILPKLTYISVNGQVICSSNEYPPPSANLELTHRIEVTTKTLQNSRPSKINNNNNNNINNNNDFFNQFMSNVRRPTTSNSVAFIGFDDDLTQNPITFKTVVTTPTRRSQVWSQSPVYTQFVSQPQPQTTPISTTITNYTPSRSTNNIPARTTNNVPPRTTINTPPRSQATQNAISTGFCGRENSKSTFTPFIRFGTVLTPGEFPWLTAIYKKQVTGLQFICGGSLISSRTVLTAAHCFKITSLTANRIVVYLGRHNLEKYSEEGVVSRDVKRLITHPEYNDNSFPDADLAILQMESPVSFMPICLWTETDDLSFIVNETGYVAGWGGDENGHEVSPLPKKVNANIVSDEECRRSNEGFKSLTSPRTLCAGNRDGSGPCMGDSGGGLMINRNGLWTLRGIVSAGQTKQTRCDLEEYVIYCDVAKHISWVRQNILM